jgi:molybdate transport system substrate-binding protein
LRILGLIAFCFAAALAPAAEPARIAAASDLKFALDQIADAFRRQSGFETHIAYGSSGNFYRQIAAGAPFELFLSADESYVARLAERGLAADAGTTYAIGRIVLFTPSGSPLHAGDGLDGLRAALADGRVKRFAIANPEHAPYGRAAEQALRHRGLWDAVKPRLVLGENASQAAQFAASGSAQGGLIAHSLALAPELASRGQHALIPAEWHEPLRQRMALMAKSGPAARAFYRYLQEPAARSVLRRHGFRMPEEG